MSESDPADPASEKLERLFIAFKMKEARLVERILTERDVDYAVAVEPLGRSLFGAPRNGAVFSVPSDRVAECTTLLEAAGLAIGVIPRE